MVVAIKNLSVCEQTINDTKETSGDEIHLKSVIDTKILNVLESKQVKLSELFAERDCNIRKSNDSDEAKVDISEEIVANNISVAFEISPTDEDYFKLSSAFAKDGREILPCTNWTESFTGYFTATNEIFILILLSEFWIIFFALSI